MDVRLGDYIQEYSVRNKAEEDIPVYSVTNSEGFCNGYFDKEVASQDRSTYKIVPRGCFAYNPSRINVGSVDWQRTVDRVIVSPLYVVFSVSSEVLPQYLYYYLKSDVALTRIRAKATGSVRDNLKFSMLQEFPFKLRNRNDQKHIIEVLDTIHSMTKLYKKQLQTLDQLIKARFIEMFGDVLQNTHKWGIQNVGDVAESVDPQPSHRTPPIDESGVPYVSIKDCNYATGEIDFDGARKVGRYVLEEHRARYKLKNGDMIIGKIGTIGNPIFVPARDDYTLSANIVLIQPYVDKVSPYFLKYSLMSAYVERQFDEAKNSTSQAAFGIQKVRAIKILNPDLTVQCRFETFARQVDKSKLSIQASLDQLETLKQSLMQKYFG